MELDIEKVVSKALDKLSNDLVKAVVTNGYFVTNVVGDNIPVRINGIYRPPDEHVIIDCEKQMTFDKDEFLNHSMKLYRFFESIEKWYKC